MITSYVGVITLRGLEFFLPESENAARFMQLRLQRCRQGHACCVWFVLDGDIAEFVARLIVGDETEAAWAIVEGQARDGGLVLPNARCWPAHAGPATITNR